MRLTEALNLRFEDIDWAHGVVTIGRAKFQKSRLVPIHKSAIQELRTYIERRNQFFAERPWRRPVNRIFVSTHGGALTSSDVGTNFRMLTRQIEIREAGASQGPRIHDCDIDLQSQRSCGGIGAAKMLICYCRCSQPIWATSSLPGRTGI